MSAPACLRLTACNISRKLSHQKLVLTPRRPRYSYYKQVLVLPYMQLLLSPRGCPFEMRRYEFRVRSQEHSGDAGKTVKSGKEIQPCHTHIVHTLGSHESEDAESLENVGRDLALGCSL